MADKEGAPKRSEAVIISTTPDICRLADGTPFPFQIVAFLSEAEDVSDDVNLNGFPATTTGTRIPRVYGNEGGAGGGVTSGVNQGWCRPVDGASSMVRVNGKQLLRHGTEFEMNCAGPDGPGNTCGKLVYMKEAPLASISADGTIVGDTDPPPEDPDELGFWKQIGGFFKGAGDAAWELVGFGGSVLQYVGDVSPLGLAGDELFDAFGEEPPAWAPSIARGERTADGMVQIGRAIWNDPSLIWEGIKAPYVKAWAQGRYGEAIGRGTFDVVTLLAGAKGLEKLGKLGAVGRLGNLGSKLQKIGDFADLFKVLKRVDTVAPDELAPVMDELVELGRSKDTLGEVVDGARKADALDDLVELGKLTPDEIDYLVKGGKLTAEEAATAKRAAAAAAADGAKVAGAPTFSRADARRLMLDSEGRAFDKNVGHAKKHVPYDMDPKKLAESRPGKKDCATWRSVSQAERDLRDIMNANREKLDALKPGEIIRDNHNLTSPRQGFNSHYGADAEPIVFRDVSWAIGRLPNGELHLLHYSPKFE
ncbi:PAAR-like domain-containing protein [Sorangium sp. So ce1078]|uniref:PAAR-like domain-containing protein n=1 Tax=Sorangium sp. So ce1078 TaxID=3133329 RepID=UPI003F5FE0A4